MIAEEFHKQAQSVLNFTWGGNNTSPNWNLIQMKVVGVCLVK